MAIEKALPTEESTVPGGATRIALGKVTIREEPAASRDNFWSAPVKVAMREEREVREEREDPATSRDVTPALVQTA